MNRRGVVLLLGLGVFASALAVIFETHQTRKLFIELQRLQSARDELNVEWGRLQLEQSSWATHGRVEAVARDQLGMSLPHADSFTVVKP